MTSISTVTDLIMTMVDGIAHVPHAVERKGGVCRSALQMRLSPITPACSNIASVGGGRGGLPK